MMNATSTDLGGSVRAAKMADGNIRNL